MTRSAERPATARGMSELDRAVLRHVEQRPASPLVLIPTSSHTVDFAAAQLCSLRTVGWQPAALVVCWDRDACSVLRDAHLPAVLEEVGGGGKGTGKGKGAGGFHFEGPHKLGGKAHPYIPTGVFHHAGRALQWLKFYLLHRVSAALAGTRVPLLVVDADILWLRPGAAALSAACAEHELDPRAPGLQPCVHPACSPVHPACSPACTSLRPCAPGLRPCAQVRGGAGARRARDGGRRHQQRVRRERQRGRHPLVRHERGARLLARR